MKTPNEAMRKTRPGALFLLRGRYTMRSIPMPRMAERIEAKKKIKLD